MFSKLAQCQVVFAWDGAGILRDRAALPADDEKSERYSKRQTQNPVFQHHIVIQKVRYDTQRRFWQQICI
jgi:hypothetical protein